MEQPATREIARDATPAPAAWEDAGLLWDRLNVALITPSALGEELTGRPRGLHHRGKRLADPWAIRMATYG